MSNKTINEPYLISINRSVTFNPTRFIGFHYVFEEQDERALALKRLNLNEVMLETTLKKNQKMVKGEDQLKRLKKMDYVRLDALVFQTLWENPQLIPEKWKEKIDGWPTRVSFHGTVLNDTNGHIRVLSLFWDNNKWKWNLNSIHGYQGSSNPSAVLAISTVAPETSVS